MKRVFTIALWVALLCAFFAGCGKTEPSPIDRIPSKGGEESSKPNSTPQNTLEDTMYIIINEYTLNVKMADNSSAKALLALLKDRNIAVDAHDYGGFEKVAFLGMELPINDEQITTEPGDVILYQGDQITVYYDTNSWNFTQLGKVQGVTAEKLKAILGGGDVTMVLSLNNQSNTAVND